MTALRAYELWQERGCPHGSAEVDWYQAERNLRRDDLSGDVAGVFCPSAPRFGLALGQEMKLRAFVKAFDEGCARRLPMREVRRFIDLGYLGVAGLSVLPTPKARELCRSVPTLRVIAPSE